MAIREAVGKKKQSSSFISEVGILKLLSKNDCLNNIINSRITYLGGFVVNVLCASVNIIEVVHTVCWYGA